VIAYFDTSALLPLVLEEASSPTARQLWREASHTVSVRIVYAELRAGLAQAVQRDRVAIDQTSAAMAAVDRLYEQLELLEVDDLLVRQAGNLAEGLGLRGYDAVHLAGATTIADASTVLVAGDGALLTSARLLGLAVVDTSRPSG
jgi:uncharacterized protein